MPKQALRWGAVSNVSAGNRDGVSMVLNPPGRTQKLSKKWSRLTLILATRADLWCVGVEEVGGGGGFALNGYRTAGLLRAVLVIVMVCGGQSDMNSAFLFIDPTVTRIIDLVSERYRANVRTAAKLTGEAERLFRYLRTAGIEQWGDVTSEEVLSWCWAARQTPGGEHARPSVSTACNRQWAAMAVLEAAETLGLVADAGRLAGERIPRSGSVSTRPLTDGEAKRVRGFADRGQLFSKRAVIVALAFAGGASGEIAAVRKCDIDLEVGTVRIGARVNPVCEWGQQMIGTFLQIQPCISDDEPLAVGQQIEADRRAHAVTVRLGEVIGAAGLRGTPGVSARSVRLYTAKQILDSLGLEAAAWFLGSDSLTSVVKALGYDWKQAGQQQLRVFMEGQGG